jgi:protocatechuate 3,4-dioxygenase beta subunit
LALSYSRRDFLRSAAGTVAALELARSGKALGTQAPDVCVLASEQEVGPYYVNNELIRRDIRENRSGFPLLLELAIINSRSCKPLAQAAIDVWHCDASGVYSGYTTKGRGPGRPGGPPPGFDPEHPGNMPPPPIGAHPNPDGIPEGLHGPDGGPPENKPSDNLTFLRRVQLTDELGRVRFQTVFPGFYMGRVNHIHFKVRLGGRVGDAEGHATYLAGHTVHVGQVFFQEDVTAELMKLEPYAQQSKYRTTAKEDMIFQRQHGTQSLSGLEFVRSGSPAAGLRGQLTVAVDPGTTLA